MTPIHLPGSMHAHLLFLTKDNYLFSCLRPVPRPRLRYHIPSAVAPSRILLQDFSLQYHQSPPTATILSACMLVLLSSLKKKSLDSTSPSNDHPIFLPAFQHNFLNKLCEFTAHIVLLEHVITWRSALPACHIAESSDDVSAFS